jgi:hypothetical protein
MSEKRFAAVQSDGWRLENPQNLVESTDDNIDQVLADVGNDPVKAAAAMDVEAAGKNRPTLISRLAAIAGGTDPGTTPEKE